jgi:hypothetical protein
MDIPWFVKVKVQKTLKTCDKKTLKTWLTSSDLRYSSATLSFTLNTLILCVSGVPGVADAPGRGEDEVRHYL